MSGRGSQALQPQHLADHARALQVQHARLQAVHSGNAGGNKREQRVSVVCGGGWAPRLVADDQEVGLYRHRVRLLFAGALSNWRDGAEAARGVETYCNVIPAALNHVDAAAIAQLLAAEQGDPVVRCVAVEHNDGDVGIGSRGDGCHGVLSLTSGARDLRDSQRNSLVAGAAAQQRAACSCSRRPRGLVFFITDFQYL